MYQDRKEMNSLRCLSDASSAAASGGCAYLFVCVGVCTCLCVYERVTDRNKERARDAFHYELWYVALVICLVKF